MPTYKFNKIDGYESSYESDGETEYKIGKKLGSGAGLREKNPL